MTKLPYGQVIPSSRQERLRAGSRPGPADFPSEKRGGNVKLTKPLIPKTSLIISRRWQVTFKETDVAIFSRFTGQDWNLVIQALPVDERNFWQRAFEEEARKALGKLTAGDCSDRGQSHRQGHRISYRSKTYIESD
jgi:hypothetical protein